MTTPTPPPWTPTTTDVGAVIARLVPDQNGQNSGVFTAATIPTDTQVQGLIVRVVADVALTIGTVPVEAWDVARDVAAIGAAARVATAFFPEVDDEFLRRLYDQFDAALERLRGNVQRITGGGADGFGNDPQGAFPIADYEVDRLLVPYSRWRW